MSNRQINVLVCRGVSGSGKSSFADLLCRNVGTVKVCADDFFTDKYGNYNFDASKLFQAHQACQKAFVEALREPTVDTIIVANTNTNPRDYKFYVDKAADVGAKVFFIVIENKHGGKNIHGVSEEILEKQESRILSSLKLR